MKSTINYTDTPTEIEQALDDAVIVSNILPTPHELVRKTKKEKITIAIDEHSLALYRSYAKKHGAKYQTIINGVLSSYADKFLSHK